MEKLSPTTTGLVIGAIMGGWHLLWSVLVAVNWGQPVMDFILWMYFVKPFDLIEPFELMRAISLVVVSSIVGFVLGSAAARLWNRFRAQVIRSLERETAHRVTRCL